MLAEGPKMLTKMLAEMAYICHLAPLVTLTFLLCSVFYLLSLSMFYLLILDQCFRSLRMEAESNTSVLPLDYEELEIRI